MPLYCKGHIINNGQFYSRGIDDSCGSEDKFDGKSFPLELHIVFYKKDYKSVDAGLEHKDGLTVLACIFEVTEIQTNRFLF